MVMPDTSLSSGLATCSRPRWQLPGSRFPLFSVFLGDLSLHIHDQCSAQTTLPCALLHPGDLCPTVWWPWLDHISQYNSPQTRTRRSSSDFPEGLERDAVSSTRALSPADITHFLTPQESVICSYWSSHFLTPYSSLTQSNIPLWSTFYIHTHSHAQLSVVCQAFSPSLRPPHQSALLKQRKKALRKEAKHSLCKTTFLPK